MKPTKYPAREKKNEAKKKKPQKRGGEKAKSKRQDCCMCHFETSKLEILLSAHARTSQANILHLNQGKR